MKKYITVIFLMLFLALSVFATSQTIVTELSTGSAATPEFEFGFSSTEVLSWQSNATRLGPIIEFVPSLDADGNVYANEIKNAPNGVFVYWRLLTLDTITLTLKIDGPLDNGVDKIDWKIEWDYEDGKQKAKVHQVLNSQSGTLGPLDLAICTPPPIYQGFANTVPLTITTSKLNDKNMDAVYSAVITLGITLP